MRKAWIPVLAGLLVLADGAALSWAWWRLDTETHADLPNKLLAWGSAGTAIATVLVALFAGSAIWAASQEARRSNRMGRARTTMNFIYEWRRQATSQSQKLEEHLGSEEAVEAFADLDDKVTRRLVRDLLEPVEHLALGTMYGAFDEEIVYELTRARVIKLWGRHENYVTAMRRGDPPKHGAQPSAYEHFERLQRELAEREQSETDERRRATQREADKSRRQSQRRAKRAERDARKEQERTARGRRRKLKRVDE